ncbi:MAG: FecR domain-containing protein [Bacteroidota bacterium]
MTKEDFVRLAEKYNRKEATKEESRLVESFYEKLQNKNLSPQWSQFQEKEMEQKLLDKINLNIQGNEEKAQKQPLSSWGTWRVAASIAVILGLGIGAYQVMEHEPVEVEYAHYVTKRNQRASVTLPEGTEVKLNAGSSLSFPNQFAKDKREVTLIGEAFFDVTKDASRPFVISSGEITTTVLGTSFNVRSYPEENTDVTVIEGKVKVESEVDCKVLNPGEQALFSLDDKTLMKEKVDVQLYAGWTNPELNFEMVPFETVLERLERWYRMEIVLSENSVKEDCFIRAKFKNEGLIPILYGLQTIVSFEYDHSDVQKIIIKNNGCVN